MKHCSRDMSSLEKLSGAMGLVDEKKDSLRSVMGLAMLEWKDVEGHLKMVQGFASGCFDELEFKEKHLKAVQESVSQSCKEFDSKRMWVEEGLKKLDEKAKFLKGILLEIEEVKRLQFERMKDYLEEQINDVALKEKHFQALFEDLKLIQSQVEKKENELDSREKILMRREDEVDSREKKLDLRENEVDAKERIWERRQNVLDSEEKKLERRLNELDLKEKILVSRENEIDSKEKILGRRENDIDSKEKMLDIRKIEVDSKEKLLKMRENMMDSEEKRMEREENELDKKEKNLMNLVKELEVKEGILDLKFKLVSIRNPPEQFIQEPDSVNPTQSAEVRGERRKRCVNSVLVSRGIPDADDGIIIGENSSKHAKRSCNHDKFSRQIKAHASGKTGGSNAKPQEVSTPHIVVLDGSESDSDSMGNLNSNTINDPTSLFSSSIEKGKLVRRFNIGETWACFDAKDNMPRLYAQVIKVIDRGEKVRLGVAWLKPFPVYKGEKEWIEAGLPVSCGKFERNKTSIESPSIFSHLILSAGEDSYIIVPFQGETWAIYKEWDIVTWVSHPEIHRQCGYEIVEILSYPQGGPSSLGVRVACLDKIKGSVNLCQRRRQKGDSFLIKPNSLYRFSHKVPSIQKICNEDCIFELDLKSLPLALQ